MRLSDPLEALRAELAAARDTIAAVLEAARAELVAARAEIAAALREMRQMEADLAAARATLAAVRALHQPDYNQRDAWCSHCRGDWPCQTVGALAAGGTGETPEGPQ